jgi:DNA-binding FrmR family transcriptional regulator
MEKLDSKEQECGSCEEPSAKTRKGRKPDHPDHSPSKKRINRIKGQLNAVSRMIDERKYCPDILQQIRAATNAMRGLETEVLRGHLRGCVKNAFESRNTFDMNDKVEEILDLWSR